MDFGCDCPKSLIAAINAGTFQNEPRWIRLTVISRNQGAVVVHNQMQIEPDPGRFVYSLEKTNELLMPMARFTITDHHAVQRAANKVVVPWRL